MNNICAIFFSEKTEPIQKPINIANIYTIRILNEGNNHSLPALLPLALEPLNTNFPSPQVLWARDIRVSGTRESVILAKSSGERSIPRNFGLLLTLRGTHVRLIV